MVAEAKAWANIRVTMKNRLASMIATMRGQVLSMISGVRSRLA
jgi:hypothetical protein